MCKPTQSKSEVQIKSWQKHNRNFGKHRKHQPTYNYWLCEPSSITTLALYSTKVVVTFFSNHCEGTNSLLSGFSGASKVSFHAHPQDLAKAGTKNGNKLKFAAKEDRLNGYDWSWNHGKQLGRKIIVMLMRICAFLQGPSCFQSQILALFPSGKVLLRDLALKHCVTLIGLDKLQFTRRGFVANPLTAGNDGYTLKMLLDSNFIIILNCLNIW